MFDIPNILEKLTSKESSCVTGLPGGSKAYVVASYLAKTRKSMVLLTQEDLEADGLAADLDAWTALLPAGERPAVIYFPALDEPMRVAALGRWTEEPFAILLSSKAALEKPVYAPEQMNAKSFELRPGRDYPRSVFLEKLAQGGFSRTDMVEMEGELAVRGEIVDVWAAGQEKPWRLLFDGDTLESIRAFSPGTQRSEGYLSPQKLLPFKETQPDGSLRDYVTPETPWFWDDLDPVDGTGTSRFVYKSLPPMEAIDLGFKSTVGLVAGIERAAQEARQAKAAGKQVIFFSHNAGESERLAELLDEQWGARGGDGLTFVVGPLRDGFMNDQLLVLTNAEIFGRYRHRPRAPRYKGGGRIREVSDLRKGDYVVHEHFGIGRYKGLELVSTLGQEAEFLKLEYSKGDKLYVPLAEFKQVQKYSGSEGKTPRLGSLDSASWENVKARVKESVREIAKDLLKVHATRAALPGHAFPADAHLEQEFSASFLYEETADQIRAIAEVKHDMEMTKPMDRLILGDVGYGKTEVAMRAAMKAIVDSKQVAVLVPTTILAEQHFRTFSERFADYPAKIGMLSRFQSLKEVKETLVGIANGSIDIVIGTHRLLQKDITFHDLGLLIIDEEHRFGVTHKEQMKKLRGHLDVLTMTATPIPRTLSFALSGMRDLSIIETPPTGRLPIGTHVGPYDDQLVKKAIQQELDRGGQVFYVHNRVQSLNTRLHFLKQLMPEVSVGVVHGQMSGPAIEKVMWEFLHRKHQILLATTIIESGIDIPSVNTLIVEEAEEFGLSQLYQLRGRVGRERQKAYCYLFYSGSVPLTNDARARLEALREYTELGSGYRLAVRDMEIRGAGNLLGQQQHGHIAAVGLDLYTQLLQEEIAHLKGEAPPQALRFPSMDLAVHAFLPADYLPSEELRILFYKKLVSTETQEALETVRAELVDRFGPMPSEALALLDVSRLRITARDLGIDGVVQKPSSLEVRFVQNTPVEPARIIRLAEERAGLRFKPGPPFTLQIPSSAYENSGPLRYLEELFVTLRA